MADFLLELCNEPAEMRAVIKYSARTPEMKGLDVGDSAAHWVRGKLRSRNVPLLYRLGILVRSLLRCAAHKCLARQPLRPAAGARTLRGMRA